MEDDDAVYDRGFEAGVESMRHEYQTGRDDGYDEGHSDGYAAGYSAAKADLNAQRAPSEFAEPFGGEVEEDS